MAMPERSPIKDKPLRSPGQSLEEQMRELFDNKVMIPLVGAVIFIVFAAMEWYRHFSGVPPSPKTMSVLAVLTSGYAVMRFFSVRREFRRLRQGADGEKAVGQFLEGLRERGYRVFHDILGQSFNVDHVLIGPAGVFTVETKTWSKPARGEARIVFDGEKILAGSFEPDRDPVIQARAQAGWMKEFLAESTARRFEVRSVILFPGWYVEQTPGSSRQLWVLNPKALETFLSNEPERLSPDEIKLASFHLSRFIRSSEAQRSRR